MSSAWLSTRIKPIVGFEFILKDLGEGTSNNPYSSGQNEEGIINLSTAHNASISELIVEKLNQPDLLKWDSSMLPYGPAKGILRLRRAMATFLTDQYHPPQPLDPDKFILMNGVTSLLNALPIVICEHGDTILTPSPMYGAIPRDLLFQAGVKVFPAHLNSQADSSDGERFKLTAEILEESLAQAKKQGHTVKAFLLTNPCNPLGTVYTRKQILSYLTFCHRHSLHCIVDEIYMSSIYKPTPETDCKSTSVLSFHPDDIPDKLRTHVLWGMAKDFGMPGSPLGALYSWNSEVRSALDLIVDFYRVPTFIQVATAKLLEDKKWLTSTYLPTNHKILKEFAQITMATLDKLGVPYIEPRAGLFLWADFGKYLSEKTTKCERHFAFHLLKHGIAVPPGIGFLYEERGWFRLVFSVPRDHLIEAMKRLKAACQAYSQDRLSQDVSNLTT